MKYLYLPLIILLSGCCVFTSQDCDCEPPNPDLTEETLSWMDPYRTQTNFIFENNNNVLDTVSIQFEKDTEYCGGEECGSDCKIERARITGFRNYSQDLMISARDRECIAVNNFRQVDSLMVVIYCLNSQEFSTLNEFTTVSYETKYDWNDQNFTVLKVDCDDPEHCSAYTMTRMIISEEMGLVEFELSSGEVWKRVN